MKIPVFLLALPLAVLCGCGHVDLTPEGEGNSSRVVTGTVELPGDAALPPDAIVVVRLVDPTNATVPSPTAVLGGVSTPPLAMSQPPAVLGEETIRHPARQPVAFRIEYTATDDQLRHGLNLEVRVAFGGKVRYSNLRGYGVTINNFGDPHQIVVSSVGH